MATDATYQPKTYRDQGGDRIVVAGGGTLDIQGRVTGLMPTTDYFVDATTGSDSDDGLSWANAKATIGAAMTLAAALGTRGRARIFVAPAGYAENVVTPLNAECPFGQLIAWNPTGYRSFGAAYIYGVAGVSLTVRARGWLIQGFEIGAVANQGCVWLDGSTTDSSAQGTVLRDCIVSGWGAAATWGIRFTGNGAPHSFILNNHISGCVGNAVECTDSGTDQPRFIEIAGNTFVDNGAHLNMNPRGFKESWIHHNCFLQVGANRTASVQIDNRGGSACMIGPGNALSDTYDNAGGYYAGSDEDWYGNACQDGFSAANPAP